MKNEIDYKELIDLEYFFNQDRETDDIVKHKRDRKLFLLLQAEKGEQLKTTPKSLIRAWIEKRVAQDFAAPGQKSPGSIFSELRSFFNILLIIKGIIAGLLAGLFFFSYTGTTPVNVFHFLLFFVFSQLLLVTILISSLALRKMLPELKTPSFYSFLFRRPISTIISYFQKKWLQQMGAERRLSIDHAFGIFRVQSKSYGSLFYWPLFLLSQLFTIFFNLGLLTTTLFKVTTSDLAFGWQSTLQLSSAAIHQFTKLLALPWRYLVPGDIAYPSLQEIEGSRIILKDGIYHLSTMDLIAWWPFLVFCLIFYGLVFRLFFYGFGKVMERRSLKNISLDSANCQGLLRRMQTPVVTTQAPPEPAEKGSRDNLPPLQQTEKSISETVTLSSQLVFVPDEIFNICKPEILEPYLRKRRLTVKKIIRFMENYEQDQQLLVSLQNELQQEQQELCIIMEGWMVPLVGFISYLRQLRQILPDGTIIHLGLVGCPEGDTLTAVKKSDYQLWQKKITAYGDPHLDLFSLLPGNSLI